MNLNVHDLIRTARQDPALLAQAGVIAAELISASFASDHARKPNTLRGSDAGSCVRAVWSDVHGKNDIPEDFEAKVKMDLGTMSGALNASLFKVAVEAGTSQHGRTVELEVKMDAGDITISIDALVRRVQFTGPERDEYEHMAEAVVEFKATFGPGTPIAPHVPYKSDKNGHARKFQVYQAVRYAMETGAEKAIIFTTFPGSFDGRFDESHYEVAEWREETRKDFARLSAALGDARPDGDPREPWRCKSCRYGACELNANPMREVT